MISKCFAVMGALTLLSAAAHAESAPKELYAKSIIISWTEHRNQRILRQANFRDVDISQSYKIYISTKGQWFSRFARAAGEAGFEAVGTSGTSSGGGPREVQISGRNITVTGSNKSGMARRQTINFNDSFTTCEAQVIFAKQPGHNVVVGYNLITGAADKEIRSATVSNVSCSVRDGNVFAQ
jgi:hypothetical protein